MPSKPRPCNECSNMITSGSKSGLCKTCAAKGSRCRFWRGDNVGYHGIHYRVQKKWPKKGRCERCEKSGVKTHWSNNGRLSPNDRSDWEELCISCHKVKDMTDKARKNMSMAAKKRKPNNCVPVIQIGVDAIIKWNSATEAGRELGISNKAIGNALSSRSGSAGGFKWRYAQGGEVN